MTSMWVVLMDTPDEQGLFVDLYPTKELAEERVTEENAHDPYPCSYRAVEAEVETKVEHREVKRRRPIVGGARYVITDIRDPDLAGD